MRFVIFMSTNVLHNPPGARNSFRSGVNWRTWLEAGACVAFLNPAE
jgi:hypothetical protein